MTHTGRDGDGHRDATPRRAHLVAAALALMLVGLGLLESCSDDEGGAKPDKETFCAKVAEFNTGTQAFDLNVADDADVERVAQLLDEIQASAPEEIRDDVDARFAYVDDVIAASQGDEDAVARLGETEPGATDEAQARIDAYAQQQCGITLEPAGTTPTSTSGVVPPPSVPTTVPPDTTPATDTVPPDTVAPDTSPDPTEGAEAAPVPTTGPGSQ